MSDSTPPSLGDVRESARRRFRGDSDFAEYGLGGDYAGARRARRAFRFSVAACVFFTLVLWFSEGYLRYDTNETQYRMSLTLHEEQARPILRNVVKRDSASDVPTAKYVQALAAVEEADLILTRYKQAYQMNPSDASLIIRYGCRLFLNRQYREARERFREAGVEAPENALPKYLEAAALAAQLSEEDDLSEALALVARTNNSGHPPVFPEALWHASLRERGLRYATLRRETADLCCAPLYSFKNLIIARARSDIESGYVHDWDSWLEKLESMGKALVGGQDAEPANLGTPQAIAGVQFQFEAIELRKRIGEIIRGAPSAGLIERSMKLEDALADLKSFENTREQRIDQDRRFYQRPLRLLGISFGLLLFVYLLSVLLNKIVHAGRDSRTVPHSNLGKGLILSGLACLLLLLFAFTLIPRFVHDTEMWLRDATVAWYAILGVLAGLGIVYPALVVPSARRVVGDVMAELPAARRSRRMAYVSLMRRYYGIVFGALICVVCIWVVGFRLMTSLYPMQLQLLVTGLEAEELVLVRQVQALLTETTQLAPVARELVSSAMGGRLM